VGKVVGARRLVVGSTLTLVPARLGRSAVPGRVPGVAVGVGEQGGRGHQGSQDTGGEPEGHRPLVSRATVALSGAEGVT
jgi:hypothetical protein